MPGAKGVGDIRYNSSNTLQRQTVIAFTGEDDLGANTAHCGSSIDRDRPPNTSKDDSGHVQVTIVFMDEH